MKTNRTKPRRVLMAWEYGHNLGHLSRLAEIARGIKQHGAQPVWAIPAGYHNHAQLTGVDDPRVTSPGAAFLHGAGSQRVDSFADILASFGFSNAQSLLANIQAWLQIIDNVKPDRIVLDYAPGAQLAAHLVGLPAFQISNGFDAPPNDCPVFGVTARGPYLDRRNAQTVERLSAAIGQVGLRITGRAGYDLASMFDHPTKVFDCIEETDPYAPRLPKPLYVGPLGAPPRLSGASWPKLQLSGFRATPRVFAYLRNTPNEMALIKALGHSSCAAIVVLPDATPEILRQLFSPNLCIVNEPIELRKVLLEAHAVISYGAVTLACKSLLAGLPQLIAPNDMEKNLLAKRVAAQGVATCWLSSTDSPQATIERFLEGHTLQKMREAAAQIAARYPAQGFVDKRSELFKILSC